MKIECTRKQKNTIISILIKDNECFMLCDCDGLTCNQCLNRRIEWNIIDETEEHKQCAEADKKIEELKKSILCTVKDDSPLQKAYLY